MADPRSRPQWRAIRDWYEDRTLLHCASSFALLSFICMGAALVLLAFNKKDDIDTTEYKFLLVLFILFTLSMIFAVLLYTPRHSAGPQQRQVPTLSPPFQAYGRPGNNQQNTTPNNPPPANDTHAQSGGSGENQNSLNDHPNDHLEHNQNDHLGDQDLPGLPRAQQVPQAEASSARGQDTGWGMTDWQVSSGSNLRIRTSPIRFSSPGSKLSVEEGSVRSRANYQPTGSPAASRATALGSPFQTPKKATGNARKRTGSPGKAGVRSRSGGSDYRTSP